MADQVVGPDAGGNYSVLRNGQVVETFNPVAAMQGGQRVPTLSGTTGIDAQGKAVAPTAPPTDPTALGAPAGQPMSAPLPSNDWASLHTAPSQNPGVRAPTTTTGYSSPFPAMPAAPAAAPPASVGGGPSPPQRPASSAPSAGGQSAPAPSRPTINAGDATAGPWGARTASGAYAPVSGAVQAPDSPINGQNPGGQLSRTQVPDISGGSGGSGGGGGGGGASSAFWSIYNRMKSAAMSHVPGGSSSSSSGNTASYQRQQQQYRQQQRQYKAHQRAVSDASHAYQQDLLHPPPIPVVGWSKQQGYKPGTIGMALSDPTLLLGGVFPGYHSTDASASLESLPMTDLAMIAAGTQNRHGLMSKTPVVPLPGILQKAKYSQAKPLYPTTLNPSKVANQIASMYKTLGSPGDARFSTDALLHNLATAKQGSAVGQGLRLNTYDNTAPGSALSSIRSYMHSAYAPFGNNDLGTAMNNVVDQRITDLGPDILRVGRKHPTRALSMVARNLQ